MARADKLRAQAGIRMMICGYPGTGKTGALAALANAGFKLRIVDFDGNMEPLLQYTRPECLKNIDIVSLEDELSDGGQYVEPKGVPTAFTRAMKLLDRWKYIDPDGEPEIDPKTNEPRKNKAGEVLRYIDLGRMADWGPDTVVVTDGLTSMGAAAFRRARGTVNKTPMNTTRQVWTLAINDQAAYVDKTTAGTLRCHTIMLAHLKIIGPKDVEADDDTLTKDLKKRVADIVPTRLYPSALGREYASACTGHFPIVIRAEVSSKGKRRLIWTPSEELDLKLPGRGVEGEVGIEDGLLKIFRSLGVEPPVA